MSAQIPPYTAWWNEQNHRVVDQLLSNAGGPSVERVLVSIGDSSALGIGAQSPAQSYIGQIGDRLTEHTETVWSTINLSMSGARVRDGLDRQLPMLGRLMEAGLQPDLVICCLGSNDVFWKSGQRRESATKRNALLRSELSELVNGLPPTAVVGETAGASERARLANDAIRNQAKTSGLPSLNPWREEGLSPRERISEDRFHLNERGYALMARAFMRTVTHMV